MRTGSTRRHEWLDILVERVPGLPVLAIVTYRPEFNPAWLGQSHVTVITLNRLGRRDSTALVNRIAKQRDLPTVLLERILERTDGVPLFIEEMTKSVESGTCASRSRLRPQTPRPRSRSRRHYRLRWLRDSTGFRRRARWCRPAQHSGASSATRSSRR